MTSSQKKVQQTMEILLESERIADKILVNKQEIINLDKRRQSTREAVRETGKSEEEKVWITVGSLLVKVNKDKALELLNKDMVQIDSEINKLRSDQKVLVNEHRDKEHLNPFTGTNLKPLSSKEMSTLRANLPLI